MREAIIIKEESDNRNRWINVFIPANAGQHSSASIRDGQGAVLQRVRLNEGNNAIDISHFSGTAISIKVETPYETILKEIKTAE
jgi:hypothetical protein